MTVYFNIKLISGSTRNRQKWLGKLRPTYAVSGIEWYLISEDRCYDKNCNRIWKTKTPWTQSLSITLPTTAIYSSVRTTSTRSHDESNLKQARSPSWRGYCWRSAWVLSREDHHRNDLQLQNLVWKVPSTSVDFVSCLHRLKNSPVAHHLAVHYITRNLACSIEHLYCKLLVQFTWMAARKNGIEQQFALGKGVFAHPDFSTFSRKDYIWCDGRNWWWGKYRRQN